MSVVWIRGGLLLGVAMAHAGTCEYAATLDRVGKSARNHEDGERNQGRYSNDTSSSQQESTQGPGTRKGRGHRQGQGGLLKQMLTLSLTIENELNELRGLFIHTFLFSEETEVMRCVRWMGESVPSQGGGNQVSPVRQCGSTSRSTGSTWTAERVGHARWSK